MTTKGKSYNKADFVSFIATRTGFSKVDAEKYISVFIDSVTAAANEKTGIELVGFGSFNIKHVEARSGRNPKTGETMQIKAYNKITFKPGKKLKDACN